MTQAKRNKSRAQLIKQLDRDLHAKGRIKLRELREHIAHARKWRAQRLPQIRILCARNRDMARERAKIARAEISAAAKLAKHEATRQIREEARGVCQAKKEEAKSRGLDSIQRAQVALKAESEYLNAIKRADRPVKLGAGYRSRRSTTTAAERRAESDDEVRNDIDPELAPVWEKVKHRIKATPHMTRTEAFADWAHKHPADVDQIIYADHEAAIEELIRAEARQRRELSASPSKRRKAARKLADAAELANEPRESASQEIEPWDEPREEQQQIDAEDAGARRAPMGKRVQIDFASNKDWRYFIQQASTLPNLYGHAPEEGDGWILPAKAHMGRFNQLIELSNATVSAYTPRAVE
jgi:hypothetical protein